MNIEKTKTVLSKIAVFGFFPGIIGVSLFPANTAWLLAFAALMTGLTAFAVFMAIVVFGQIKKAIMVEPLTDDELDALIAENDAEVKAHTTTIEEGEASIFESAVAAWRAERLAWDAYRIAARKFQDSPQRAHAWSNLTNARFQTLLDKREPTECEPLDTKQASVKENLVEAREAYDSQPLEVAREHAYQDWLQLHKRAVELTKLAESCLPGMQADAQTGEAENA